MITATYNDGDHTYTADLDADRVTLARDGVWAGTGRWTGRSIVDCPADVGDDVYEALDALLTGLSVTPAEMGGAPPMDLG